MNDLIVARLKKDLKKVDRLNNQIARGSDEESMESVKAWWSIRAMAREYKGIDCSAIEGITDFPDSSARAIFFIELIRNNPDGSCRRYLESCLDHENTLVCEDACYALANYRGPEIQELLAKKLDRTDDQYLRDALVRALSHFDHEDVPEYVLDYYRMPEKRADAIEALGNINSVLANDMLLDAWFDNDDLVSSMAYRKLQSEERGTEHVKRRLRDITGSKKGQYQVSAITLLGKHKDEASIQLFRAIYQKVSQKARQQILLSLGKIGTADATDALLALMEVEETPEVIAYGFMGLGTCEHRVAVDRLISVIRERPYGTGEIKPVGLGLGGGLYEIAASAIKRNPVPESIRYMTELLAYGNPEVRVEMAKGLATRKAVQALDALESAIANEADDHVRAKLDASYKRLLKHKK